MALPSENIGPERVGGVAGQVKVSTPSPARRRAASIYGTIVTAAVIAAGGDQLSTAALEAAVLVTLVVYWLAEQYAELLSGHTHDGHLPGKSEIRASLLDSWPMVSSSFLPLLALLLARAAGASTLDAAEIALALTVALLIFHGHSAGKAAGLTGARLTYVTVVAALLGIAMVVLKALLQHQHHLY